MLAQQGVESTHCFCTLITYQNLTPPGTQPPTDVAGVQDGSTSIRVTWTPPSPLGDTTGYRIHYTNGGGSSDSQTVSGGNTMTHTLTGLTNGETYTISIVATSSALPSSPVQTTVGLGKSTNTCSQCLKQFFSNNSVYESYVKHYGV